MEEKIELEPCPFCGGSTTSIDVRRLSPTMKGPGAIISVTLRHHCRREEGQPSGLNVSMHGRDEASAIAAWNRRSSPSRERVEVLEGQLRKTIDACREALSNCDGGASPYANAEIGAAYDALEAAEALLKAPSDG